MPTRVAAFAAAIATVALWASAFPAIRVALAAFSPAPLAALRFAVAAAIMLAWMLVARPRLPARVDFLPLALCAVAGIALYNVLLNLGQTTVAAGAASFIVNTVPAITALLAALLLGERLGCRGWAGSAVSLAGIAVIAFGQPEAVRFGAGAVLVLAAAICQAAFFVLQRPLIGRYGATVCAAVVVCLGALSLSPFLPAALAEAAHAPWSAMAGAVYLGVFPAAIGYATWAAAQAHFGAARAANFLYLVPPTATAMAFLLTGETPTGATLLGGAVAAGGVLLVNLRGRAAAALVPQPGGATTLR